MTTPPTVTIQQAFALAFQHHKAGRLSEAEALYRQVLAAQPDHAEALHYLGVIAHQMGRADLAVKWIREAVRLKPNNPSALSNLGAALAAQQRYHEAIAAYRRALALKPDYPETHYNLADALRLSGDLDEAMAAFQRAISLQPNYPDAYNNLGITLAARDRLDEAIAAYRQALRLSPAHVLAHYNFGRALHCQGRLDEAVVAYREAFKLKPNYPEALIDLANALRSLGRLGEAIATNRQAIERNPASPEAYLHLGNALGDDRQFEEAIAAYRQALALQPNYGRAKFNLSNLLLQRGDYEHGWPLYESRWDVSEVPEPRYAQPKWDGSPLQGQRVLIYDEQGMGDSIQFLRYARFITERGGKVIVACQWPLVELFRGAAGVAEVVASGGPLPHFDLHLSILSQPFIFKTTRDTIPAEVPYLFADPAQRDTWRERLSSRQTRLKVGLAWAGNPRNSLLRKRDIPVEMLRPLLGMEGADFFSLLVGHGAEQIRQLSATSRLIDYTAHLHDFADTAAFMAELDLIISTDTAVPHLAGALGRPVWTLLAHLADWRWGLESEHTPWYPTMRLFRQPAPGDWESVLQQVATALRDGPIGKM